MPAATLTLKIPPRRMLSVSEAAEYCGLSVKRFPAYCRVSAIELAAGVQLYDIRDLDEWIDGIKLGSADTDDVVIGKL